MVLGVELGSLYFTRIVIDFILVFYMILIYRKFNNHIQNLEYLIIHRVLILVGFVMVYLRDSISLFLSVIVGNTLFIIGAASLIFLFSQLFKIPFKKILSYFYHPIILIVLYSNNLLLPFNKTKKNYIVHYNPYSIWTLYSEIRPQFDTKKRALQQNSTYRLTSFYYFT